MNVENLQIMLTEIDNSLERADLEVYASASHYTQENRNELVASRERTVRELQTVLAHQALEQAGQGILFEQQDLIQEEL